MTQNGHVGRAETEGHEESATGDRVDRGGGGLGRSILRHDRQANGGRPLNKGERPLRDLAGSSPAFARSSPAGRLLREGSEYRSAVSAMDRRYGGGVLILAISVLAVIAAYVRLGDHDRRPIAVESAQIERVRGSMIEPSVAPDRTTAPYRGYGTWIDVFDFSPPYAGPSPPVTTDDLDEMAADAIKTIFLQSARLDDRSPGGSRTRGCWRTSFTVPTSADRGGGLVPARMVGRRRGSGTPDPAGPVRGPRPAVRRVGPRHRVDRWRYRP